MKIFLAVVFLISLVGTTCAKPIPVETRREIVRFLAKQYLAMKEDTQDQYNKIEAIAELEDNVKDAIPAPYLEGEEKKGEEDDIPAPYPDEEKGERDNPSERFVEENQFNSDVNNERAYKMDGEDYASRMRSSERLDTYNMAFKMDGDNYDGRPAETFAEGNSEVNYERAYEMNGDYSEEVAKENNYERAYKMDGDDYTGRPSEFEMAVQMDEDNYDGQPGAEGYADGDQSDGASDVNPEVMNILRQLALQQ